MRGRATGVVADFSTDGGALASSRNGELYPCQHGENNPQSPIDPKGWDDKRDENREKVHDEKDGKEKDSKAQQEDDKKPLQPRGEDQADEKDPAGVCGVH